MTGASGALTVTPLRTRSTAHTHNPPVRCRGRRAPNTTSRAIRVGTPEIVGNRHFRSHVNIDIFELLHQAPHWDAYGAVQSTVSDAEMTSRAPLSAKLRYAPGFPEVFEAKTATFEAE